MKVRTLVACIAGVVVVSVGCNATSRHKVLSFFFDGVPPPGAAGQGQGNGAGSGGDATGPRPLTYREHGPYAAGMCNACHDPGALNVVGSQGEQLCLRCHEVDLDKQRLHGPLAAGDCTACHDPHNAKYRYLLASGPEDFCFRCHDRESVEAVGVHAAVGGTACTTCHDPHASNNDSLLR